MTLRWRVFVLALPWWAACVELPAGIEDPVPVSCVSTADCPQDEICLGNQCYGDPPGGAFAVVVSPAGGDENVAQVAYPNAEISEAGDLGTFALSDAASLIASVGATCDRCDESSVAAILTLSQRAAFFGGPTSYWAQAITPSAQGAAVFKVPVLSHPVQAASLSIVPTDVEGTPWSAWLPQTRIELATPLSILSFIHALLDGQSRRVTGTVLTTGGTPVVGFVVSLTGRFASDRPEERVSALAVTDDLGNFDVSVSVLAFESATLVVAPPAGTIAPTYTLPITASPGLTELPPVSIETPSMQQVLVSAEGYASSGNKLVPTSARYIVEATFAPSPQSPELGAAMPMEGSFVTEIPIDAQGAKVLRVPTGATLYRVSVIHTGEGELGSVYRRTVTIEDLAQPIPMPRRTMLTGVLRAADGLPVSGATLSISPSVGTLWDQPLPVQALVRNQTPATALSASDGSYVLWIDTAWQATGNWRLAVTPPESSGVPLPRWATVLELGDMAQRSFDVTLPSASAVRAVAVYPNGRPASGSRLTLYRVNSINPCLTATAPPPSCELPEVVVASGTTDAEGHVQLIVPAVLPAL